MFACGAGVNALKYRLPLTGVSPKARSSPGHPAAFGAEIKRAFVSPVDMLP